MSFKTLIVFYSVLIAESDVTGRPGNLVKGLKDHSHIATDFVT